MEQEKLKHIVRRKEMKLYKLTTQDDLTRKGETNETQWGPGVTHYAKPGNGFLCSDYYIHAYESPLVAIVMNYIHACIPDPKLWEAEGEVAKRDGQLKCGCKSLTTIREIPCPTITLTQRVEIAIRCAMLVCSDKDWNIWSQKWLSGEDRSLRSACEAELMTMNFAARGAAKAAHQATVPNVEGALSYVAFAVADAYEANPKFDLHALIADVLRKDE